MENEKTHRPPQDCMNLFIGVGYLGADPDVGQTQNGIAYSNFRVGLTRSVKKGDDWESITEWVRCTCFGNKAEKMAYAKKGDRCSFNGFLQTRCWNDPNTGEKKYSTEIVCSKIAISSKHDSQNSVNNNVSTQVEAVQQNITEEDVIPF